MPDKYDLYFSMQRLFLIASLVFWTTSIHAQNTQKNVANSGMGQGEAVISVRSDVRLSILGTKGTKRENVDALANVVRKKIPAIRACYVKVVSTTPNITGELHLTMEFNKKPKRPRLTIPDQTDALVPLVPCVKKALIKTSLSNGFRPAAAVLTLTFNNTRARGQNLLQKSREANDKFPITTQNGLHAIRWTTDDGKLSFLVTAAETTSKAAVASVQRVLRDRFGVFLDCRRRASKRGMSPAGETEVDVVVKRKGKIVPNVRSTSVSHKRAPICIEKAFNKLIFDAVPSKTQLTVKIRFQE